jgi:hypothetical protein
MNEEDETSMTAAKPSQDPERDQVDGNDKDTTSTDVDSAITMDDTRILQAMGIPPDAFNVHLNHLLDRCSCRRMLESASIANKQRTGPSSARLNDPKERLRKRYAAWRKPVSNPRDYYLPVSIIACEETKAYRFLSLGHTFSQR